MYARKTQRKNKDGSVVEYLALAINKWDSVKKSVSAEVVYSFGRLTPETRTEMVRLAKSIARICNLTVIDPMEEDQNNATSINKSYPLAEGFTQELTREFGTAYVLEAIWERLGLADEFRKIRQNDKCKVEYERGLLAMTLNRLCEPESKLGVWERWLTDRVYLPNGEGLKLHQFYEAMDLFYRHSKEVEEAVFFSTADLFNLKVDLIFFDTTTVTFSIDEADEDDGLRVYGRPKGGGWSPQVVVALAVTREGLPVRSWVFPGNKADVSTVEQVRKDLRGWKLGRCLFVADSGVNSNDSREEGWIQSQCNGCIFIESGDIFEIGIF